MQPGDCCLICPLYPKENKCVTRVDEGWRPRVAAGAEFGREVEVFDGEIVNAYRMPTGALQFR